MNVEIFQFKNHISKANSFIFYFRLKTLKSMTETELKDYIIRQTGLNTDLCLNYCLTQI